MDRPTYIVTEWELDAFRRIELSPTALLRLIENNVHVLARLSVGVGKSQAVDRLLLHGPLFERFDLVLYVAPTRSILEERAIIRGEAKPPVPWEVLRPRPTEKCGFWAEEWTSLQAQGCSAHAKATLCRPCQALNGECPWPDQFKRLGEVGLIFLTEQYLLSNRSLIKALTSSFLRGSGGYFLGMDTVLGIRLPVVSLSIAC